LIHRRSFLLSIDSTVGCDVDWLLQQLSSGGASRLKHELLKALPDGKQKALRGKPGIELSIAAVDAIMAAGLFRLATKQSQSLCLCVKELLCSLRDGRKPAVGAVNEEFMTFVMQRALNLHVFTPSVADKAPKPAELVGREALQARFAQAEKDFGSDGKVPMDMLEELVPWSVFLGAEQRAAIDSWLAASVAAAAKEGKAAPLQRVPQQQVGGDVSRRDTRG
jgi:hypothetical protein